MKLLALPTLDHGLAPSWSPNVDWIEELPRIAQAEEFSATSAARGRWEDVTFAHADIREIPPRLSDAPSRRR